MLILSPSRSVTHVFCIGRIIGLYTTFVIVVSAYVKGYFTGTSAHIMFEDMPYVDRILQVGICRS